jgi:hypothetical protein
MAFVKFKPIASSFRLHERINDDNIKDEINNYVTDNEKVVYSYKSTRDIVIFTDKRILFIDKKGIRGFRRSIYGINYSSISSYELNVREFDSKISMREVMAERVIKNIEKNRGLE